MFYLIVVPVLKMAVNFISLKLACFAGDILGSGRVRSMLSIIADGYSLLIAIACGLMAMFIVCIAILLKAGGSGSVSYTHLPRRYRMWIIISLLFLFSVSFGLWGFYFR